MNIETKFKIKDNEYTIKYPNAGQVLDIEFLKSSFSNGRYGDMFRSGTIDSTFALDVIDAKSYLTVLCPDLVEDLKVDSLDKLGINDITDLVKVFRSDVVPFINKWREIIQNMYKSEKDKK